VTAGAATGAAGDVPAFLTDLFRHKAGNFFTDGAGHGDNICQSYLTGPGSDTKTCRLTEDVEVKPDNFAGGDAGVLRCVGSLRDCYLKLSSHGLLRSFYCYLFKSYITFLGRINCAFFAACVFILSPGTARYIG
jgi:hypothetical protein